MPEYDWRSTAFTPDRAGYTSWYLTREGNTRGEPVIGWLTQHQAFYGGRDLEYLDEQPTLSSTRIIAAVLSDGEAVPVDSAVLPDDYWYVTGPSEDAPTDEQAAAERRHRAEYRAARARKEAQK